MLILIKDNNIINLSNYDRIYRTQTSGLYRIAFARDSMQKYSFEFNSLEDRDEAWDLIVKKIDG